MTNGTRTAAWKGLVGAGGAAFLAGLSAPLLAIYSAGCCAEHASAVARFLLLPAAPARALLHSLGLTGDAGLTLAAALSYAALVLLGTWAARRARRPEPRPAAPLPETFDPATHFTTHFFTAN